MTADGPYAAAAATYWQAGWRGILPIPPNSKKHPPKGFTGAAGVDPSYPDIHTWADGPEGAGNIALRLPRHVIGLDVDNYADKHGAEILHQRETEWGALPATWRTTSRDDGTSGIRLFRAPEGLAWPGELGPATEIIQHGHRYAVVWPSIHPEGRTYRWISPDGVTSTVIPDPDELPHLPDRWIQELTGGELATPTRRNSYSPNETAQWLALRPGSYDQPCARMSKVITRAQAEILIGSAHTTARDGALRAIRLADEGHAGLTAALTHIHRLFLDEATSPARDQTGKHRRSPAEAAKEWADIVSSATNLVTANPSPGATCDCNGQITGRILQPAEPPVTVGSLALNPQTATHTDPSASTGETAPTEPTTAEKQLEYELMVQRARRDAKALLDAEDAQRQFRVPAYRSSLVEELEIPDEPVRYLVDQVFPAGGNVLLTAAYKTGKTTLIGELARALADGTPFLGRYDVDLAAGRVAIFNYEVHDTQYRRWLRDLQIENPKQVSVLNLRGYRLPILAPYVETWVANWLAAHGIDTWIPDPFARAFTGSGNENDNSDVGAFLDALDVIKERADVRNLVMSAHTGRAVMEEGAERARGATRLDDWADVRWMLTKNDDDLRYFSATGRDVEVEEEQLSYDPEQRRLTIGGPSRKGQKLNSLVDEIVAAVEEAPGINAGGVRDALSGHRGKEVDDARKLAIKEFRIVEERGTHNSRRYYPVGYQEK